ncbi:cation/H(+) antiporter 4-like [Cucurbita moschata]|uniref:Cation/H(+) antiporter 4-like n=1 Tax=Cucurbita moschata TaxID=3662 RepID=A0A6J1G1U3_CUCMO|nr:cation/H(+) antiporter 4-like [Cucurbita moschata]
MSLIKHNSTENGTNQICLSVLPFVNSDGLWAKAHTYQWWLNSSLPLLELQLVVFGLMMITIQLLLKRLGASKISSQILTGMIFGCSWGTFDEAKFKLFRIDSEEVLGLLSYFGYTLYLFITAVKMDIRMTMQTGKKAWIIGTPSVLVPLFCGLFVCSFLHKGLTVEEIRKLPLMTSLQSMISFPVIASLLNEMKIVSTELGRLGLSSALVADIFSLLSMLISKQLTEESAAKVYYAFGALFVQVFLVSFLFRPAVLWILKRTPEGKPVSRGSTQGVFVLVLLSSMTSTVLGHSVILGPYLLGLAIPDGGPVGYSFVEKMESFVSDFFVPMFAITCALKVDLSKLFIAYGAAFTRVTVILAFVTCVVKFSCVFLGSLYCQLSTRDSLVLSLILSCKGVVELAFTSLYTEYRVISKGTMGWITFFIFILATFAPIGVKCVNDLSRKQASNQNRSIMHMSPNSELRILACIHKNENIYGLIHLLHITCPTPDNPISVYVLHLIALVGRSSPVFISHRQEDKSIGDQPAYSENVIVSFEHLEQENSGAVYAECFTTISPSKFMHNDVYKLAMDKFTSLIILCFHRTWTSDGLIDQEDNTMRHLNCSVIEKAPCSVAILADKGRLGSLASMASVGRGKCKYSVCVIFMGGNDDREAISFAKRMARDSEIDLTVLKLGSAVDDGSSKWDKILDSEVIKDFKTTFLGDGRVRFIEEESEDGPQTALRLRELVNQYDLMIVGRRKGLESSSPQTSGLSEWNEFPELGVLGDLIASLDINTRTSVLVIQQQK